MAELSLSSRMNFAEIAKRTLGKELLPIAEVLMEKKPLIKDATMIEANGLYTHTFTRRASLGSGTWRGPNTGVSTTMSRTQQFQEPISLLEARSEIDEYYVRTAPSPDKFRSDEAMGIVEGMAQQVETGIFYGTGGTGDPKQPIGISTRADYDGTSDENVWDNGDDATGAVTSLYIVQWGPRYCSLAYPRGSKSMGIEKNDLGRQLVTDPDGTNQYVALVMQFLFNFGIVIHDARNIQRICNVGTTDSSVTVDENQIIKALNHMPDSARGAVIYCNETVMNYFDILAKDKPNVQYGPADPFGRPTRFFRGVPIRIADAIVNTEDVVS